MFFYFCVNTCSPLARNLPPCLYSLPFLSFLVRLLCYLETQELDIKQSSWTSVTRRQLIAYVNNGTETRICRMNSMLVSNDSRCLESQMRPRYVEEGFQSELHVGASHQTFYTVLSACGGHKIGAITEIWFRGHYKASPRPLILLSST